MLDVRKMLLLSELSRLGTIASVARALSFTPSAVSQQLSALEREAGVPLIRRRGRGVELTAAGAELAQRTGPVLALLEQAAAAMASSKSELTGELIIGAFPTAVRTLLPAALVGLGRAHPGLELHVAELDPAGVPDALRAGTLDIALVHDYDCAAADPDPAVALEPLLEERIFLASAAGQRGSGPACADLVSPGRRDPGGPDLADPVLAGRQSPWIAASPGTLCHLMAVRLCRAAGFTPRIRHYADDFAAVLTLVAAGQGVALVPELALADVPAGVMLVPLAARRRTFIACRNGTSGHPAVAACAAALRAAAADYRMPVPASAVLS
jgi:DNA-binding transcriptional LysR family regulator